jgi:ABC-2 type transport system ATP-binding protein
VDSFAPAFEPLLSAESLTLYRGRRLIYNDLSVSFRTGVTAILGPNGAGKTTLIEGLLDPGRERRGRILLQGAIVPEQVSLRKYFSQVGHMPQSWAYFAGFTVQESVEYAAWLKGVGSRQLRLAAEESIDRVGLTAERGVKVRKLSGGMRQRVGLAEALVHDPKVVFLDEPTVGLDPSQRAMFREVLRTRGQGRSVVLSTHLTEDVEAIADRVIVVSDGQIVFDGSPSSLAARAKTVGNSSQLEAGYLAVIADSAAPEGE